MATFAEVEAELTARGTSMVFDLSRVEGLLDLLGSPQRAYPAIHVTGTNGKTSTARMIDALLRAHGLRTGRYTSPHLTTVRECIAVDGDEMDDVSFREIYREILPAVRLMDARLEPSPLTQFEVMTAMAFATFADAPVDVAVVEVGLGGADDATNVLRAETCVITPIALDHTEWLGDTVEDIAMAKAGIIHSGATVVCAVQPEPAVRPLIEHCAEVGATVVREGPEFAVRTRAIAVGGQLVSLQGLGGVYDDVFLPLHGAHQAQNAAVALAAAEVFLGAGANTRQLDPDVVRAGFATVTSPGRLERVRTAQPDQPAAGTVTILLDAAHNPHGMAAAVAALAEEFSFTRLVAVLGVFADKDVPGILELLEPVVAEVVCTRSSSPRAMAPDALGEIAVGIFGEQRVTVVPNLPDAIDVAVARAESDVDSLAGAGVLITGSVVTVGEARMLLTATR